MRARCVSFTGNHATVVIEPSWWGRLRGERTLSIDLERDHFQHWQSVATKRLATELPFGALIRDALDFREVGSEPRRVRALIGGAVAP